MPPIQDTPRLGPLLRHAMASLAAASSERSHPKPPSSSSTTNIFKKLKLLPAFASSGCKMISFLAHPRRAMLPDRAPATVTLFGPRRGRIFLSVQDDPRSPPHFLIELPLPTSSFHKELSTGTLKIALESDTRTRGRKLYEEHVWAVFCNGRKSGFSIRRKSEGEEEREVMRVLRGVSMGAGVLDGEVTYMRARFERVVGSKDSEALYMISPDSGGGGGGPEISIFLVRPKG